MENRLPERGWPSGGRRPDGLIFDLDGTLWDSTETVARSWNKALARLGADFTPITPAAIAAVMGKTHREIYRAMFPGLKESRQEALLLACYAEEERAIHARGGRLYPGVAEGLVALRRHYALCIVSNCQRGYIESFLAWSGLGPLVTDFECHGNTGAGKGENLRRVISRNGLDEAVYIGDTRADHEAAKQAGAFFIHARYGFGDAGPECLSVENFAAIARLFLSLAKEGGT